MEGFDYKKYDGLGLAELIKKKEVKRSEVIEAAIVEIEKHNPNLNAVIHKRYESAIKETEIELPGPFSGVPMLLKDITQELEGERTTAGSKAFQGYRATRDSEIVKKLRQTGTIFVGQTNVPEFALMGITEPAFYGPARNPWNTEHTPGGSSGGSAAAVASGMVPIAGANDGGGSIRIPAAFCGLFGLKPTRGRTPVGPDLGRSWQGASVDHILSRSVRDSAAMLDELKMHQNAAAFHTPDYLGSYLQDLHAGKSKKYKIAFTAKSPLGTEVHPACIEAVKRTAALLESLGHTVVEAEAPVDGKKLAKSFLTMYFGEVAATLSSLEGVLGRKAKRSDVEATTWMLGLLGKVTSAEEFVLGVREWDIASFEMEHFHETYDFYLTPTTAYPASKIGELEPSSFEKTMMSLMGRKGLINLLKSAGIVDQLAESNLKRTPFTQLANLTGQPAMSLPLHQTADGLPVGLQFAAAKGREDKLFQLAGQLEQTDHWIRVEENGCFENKA